MVGRIVGKKLSAKFAQEILLKSAIFTDCALKAADEAKYWRPCGCPVLGTNGPVQFLFAIGLDPMDFFRIQDNN